MADQSIAVARKPRADAARNRERVLEAYYNWQVRKGAWLTFDLQQIVNPGYNADRRGAVNVFGGRLHVEL